MQDSFCKIASNLSDVDFKHLNREFKKSKHKSMLREKGVYPYDYVDCLDNFGKNEFHSSLDDSGIIDHDYR